MKDTPPDSAALRALLSAASGPVHEDELAGLPAALDAFHRTAVQQPAPRRHRMSASALVTKLVAAKTLAVVAGTSFLGGVALAASTGTLPVPIQNVAHETVGAPEAQGRAHATPDQADNKGNDKADNKGRDKAGATPSATPSATATAPAESLPGRCRAYAAGSKQDRGRSLDSPAFAALATAAGGPERVEAFCRALLAAEDADKGRADGSAKGGPTAKPGNGAKTPAGG